MLAAHDAFPRHETALRELDGLAVPLFEDVHDAQPRLVFARQLDMDGHARALEGLMRGTEEHLGCDATDVVQVRACDPAAHDLEELLLQRETRGQSAGASG